jgi:hypothetical protein
MATLTLCESSGNGSLLKPVEVNRKGAHTRAFTQSKGEPNNIGIYTPMSRKPAFSASAKVAEQMGVGFGADENHRPGQTKVTSDTIVENKVFSAYRETYFRVLSGKGAGGIGSGGTCVATQWIFARMLGFPWWVLMVVE